MIFIAQDVTFAVWVLLYQPLTASHHQRLLPCNTKYLLTPIVCLHTFTVTFTATIHLLIFSG